jgi:transcriptional regulator with XRE-family HTH domain
MEEISQKELGRRLQLVRRHLGMKQSEVAEQVGCGSLTISRLERGEGVGSATLGSLLAIYSQHISLNTLFAKSFPENIEEVFLENRISVPVSFLTDQVEQMVKIKKGMDEVFDKANNDFLPRLEQTIKLL